MKHFIEKLVHNFKVWRYWKKGMRTEWVEYMNNRIFIMWRNGVSIEDISDYLDKEGDKLQKAELVRDRKTGYLYIRRGA